MCFLPEKNTCQVAEDVRGRSLLLLERQPALSPLSVDWPPILCCTVQTCSGACPVASLTTLALPGQGPPTKPPHASQQSVGRPPSGAVPAAPGNGCLQTPNSLA